MIMYLVASPQLGHPPEARRVPRGGHQLEPLGSGVRPGLGSGGRPGLVRRRGGRLLGRGSRMGLHGRCGLLGHHRRRHAPAQPRGQWRPVPFGVGGGEAAGEGGGVGLETCLGCAAVAAASKLGGCGREGRGEPRLVLLNNVDSVEHAVHKYARPCWVVGLVHPSPLPGAVLPLAQLDTCPDGKGVAILGAGPERFADPCDHLTLSRGSGRSPLAVHHQRRRLVLITGGLLGGALTTARDKAYWALWILAAVGSS